jgi:hypothetical protein
MKNIIVHCYLRNLELIRRIFSPEIMSLDIIDAEEIYS